MALLPEPDIDGGARLEVLEVPTRWRVRGRAWSTVRARTCQCRFWSASCSLLPEPDIDGGGILQVHANSHVEQTRYGNLPIANTGARREVAHLAAAMDDVTLLASLHNIQPASAQEGSTRGHLEQLTL